MPCSGVRRMHSVRGATRPIAERAAICSRFCDQFEAHRDALALELTWQMGRPIRYAASEINGTLDRARYMIDAAAEALEDVDPAPKDGFERFVRREPLGVVFTVAAWNYPYLIAVNSVIPAIMAGNAVVLKHSAQTPLCAERFAECFRAAGLPEGVFQFLHLSHEDTERIVGDARVAFVAFTGSVEGGRAIQRAAVARFVGTGLELGGCDPAYVRQDADLGHAVENLVDGAFFNSGQSCCGIQRIYVHESLYDDFVAGAIALTEEVRARSFPQTRRRRSVRSYVRPPPSRSASRWLLALPKARARRSMSACLPRAGPAPRTWLRSCCSMSITAWA